MQLKGQVAIITGASSGIGWAVSKNLNEAGMKLIITARRADRLQKLASELNETAFLAGDMMDPTLPHKLIEKALGVFGRCDVVFNNAGILEVGSIEKIDVDKVCDMVRINVEAAFRMTYVALKYFRSINRGHLVNTSSILGTKVRPTAGAYAGTKFAIEALSEALRMELAKTNIKVSCVEPGLVTTELHNHWDIHPRELLKVNTPLEPEDVARCVRFILEQPEHVRIPRMLVLPGEHEI